MENASRTGSLNIVNRDNTPGHRPAIPPSPVGTLVLYAYLYV